MIWIYLIFSLLFIAIAIKMILITLVTNKVIQAIIIAFIFINASITLYLIYLIHLIEKLLYFPNFFHDFHISIVNL